MPAPRLPWIKFWPEAVEHEKFAALSDGEAWTWVVVWAKASQQPQRWRFASVGHAAKVTGRPAKHIRRLIEARLMDEDSAGIRMHNAGKWQDRFPSDESPKPPPTLPEHSANGSSTLPEYSDKKKREIKREKRDEDVTPPAPAVLVPPVGRRRVTVADDEFIETLVSEFGERLGGPSAVRESIADALSHQACLKRTDQHAYLRNWLRKDARATPHTSPLRLSEVSGRDRDGLPLGRKLPA